MKKYRIFSAALIIAFLLGLCACNTQSSQVSSSVVITPFTRTAKRMTKVSVLRWILKTTTPLPSRKMGTDSPEPGNLPQKITTPNLYA